MGPSTDKIKPQETKNQDLFDTNEDQNGRNKNEKADLNIFLNIVLPVTA